MTSGEFALVSTVSSNSVDDSRRIVDVIAVRHRSDAYR
jgi:hypothetical protein